MQIETFECQEVAVETSEESDAAKKIAEDLGLAGQRDFYAPPEKKSASRNPYREMTAEEIFVFHETCPEETDLRSYGASPIPLRVLQVAAHAREFFDKIEVWHPERSRLLAGKDPVLVGIKSPAGREWIETPFILARWGETLEEMPALRKQAMETWRARKVMEAESARNAAVADLARIPSMDIASASKQDRGAIVYRGLSNR